MSRSKLPRTPRPVAPGGRQSPAPDSDGQAGRIRALTAQLVHDVGKYLTRTARNLPSSGAVDAGLLAMLCRDLYGGAGSARPAARLAALAAELPPRFADERLGQAAAGLAELERCEAAVRAGRADAVGQATALALQVEQLLRAIAADWQAPPGRRTR